MINSYFDSNLKDTNIQIFDKLLSVCEAIEKRNVDPKVRKILRDFLTNKLKSNNINEFDNPASFLSLVSEFLDFAHKIFLEYKIENLETLENEILKVILIESLSISRQCVEKTQLKLNEVKSVLDKLYDGVLVIDIKTRKILACNKSIQLILKTNNLVNQDVLNFAQDDKKTYYQDLFLKFAKQTKGVTEILSFKTQNNDPLQLEASVNLLNDSAMVVVFRDVTKRLENEKLLVRLNRLYEVLSRINNLVVRIQDIQTLYKEVCNILVNFGQFKLAWIGLCGFKN